MHTWKYYSVDCVSVLCGVLLLHESTIAVLKLGENVKVTDTLATCENTELSENVNTLHSP